jgi:hypothetical protein
MELIEYIAKELQDLGRGLSRYLDGLTEQEIHWVPQPKAGSIADHLFHAARFEDEFVQQRILRRPTLWESIAEDRPESGNATFTKLLDYYGAVRAGTLDCMAQLSPSDLERPAPIPQGQVRVADILSIVCCHFAQHLGAITYIRRLQRGPDGVEHE